MLRTFPLVLILLVLLLTDSSVSRADSYSLTLLTEQGAAITAAQDWSRQLATAGIRNVRIRSARRGEQPSIVPSESKLGTHYQVVGLLARNDKLLLPGRTFSFRQMSQLKDYLAQVVADGASSVTAGRDANGLTKPQFEACFKALARPVAFVTQGQTVGLLLRQLQTGASLNIRLAAGLGPTLERLPCQDDLQGLSMGTALAILLKAQGLAFAPEKPRGKPVQLQVDFSKEIKHPWPIGYRPQGPISQTAPIMLTQIKVEIEGYSLEEAMGAVAPRLKMPVLWDHAALAAKQIRPAEIQVQLSGQALYYRRILDKLLFQAHLRGQLKTDEAGKVFYWISR